MTYEERCLAMDEFRTGKIRALICTHVPKKGINIF